MLQNEHHPYTMEEKARREKEEIRLALAKAYFESKIENTDDFFASLLLSSSSSSSSDSSSLLKSNKNEILKLWRSALQEEHEGGEKEKVDDDAMIRTALREVFEAKFTNKNEGVSENELLKLFTICSFCCFPNIILSYSSIIFLKFFFHGH